MPRRRMSIAKYKTAIQHADTLVSNIGGASAPTQHVMLTTDVGARTTTGASQQIQDSATTGETVRIGDIVKYINVFLQVGTRPAQAGSANDSSGWIEYAITMAKESDTAIPITQLGTKTLGEVATNMYRNECIWTGFIPVGETQPSGTQLRLKVPKFKQKIRVGDEWSCWVYFRDMNATATETDSQRVVQSCMYKSYS